MSWRRFAGEGAERCDASLAIYRLPSAPAVLIGEGQSATSFSSEASTCPVHSDCPVVSRARRVNGTLGARPRCNPGQAAFGVRGTGYAGGTASVFSIAILVTMNTPRLLSQNE